MKYTTYSTPRADLGVALEENKIDIEDVVIADKISPYTPVAVKSATMSVITRESIMQAPDTEKAPKGGYVELEYEAEDRPYSNACR